MRRRFRAPRRGNLTGDGNLFLAFHIPDKEAVKALKERYADVKVRRLMRSKDEGKDSSLVVVDRGELTGKQEKALRKAHEMGYFEHPNDANAGEVAEELGVSTSTFTEHLAEARRRLMGSIVDGYRHRYCWYLTPDSLLELYKDPSYLGFCLKIEQPESVYMNVERQIDLGERSYRYYRNAVERHWDPHDIELEQDRQNLLDADIDEEFFEGIRVGIARFGAGEEAVTEDLAPFSVVLEDIEDQMYVTTQIYEEAKHTDFFDRYWRNVINPVEEEMGLKRSSPLEERWFNDAYDELFERNERATSRLLEEDTPENRARAFSHYHLTIEGIAAQTGYYGMGRSYSDEECPELPHLPGLVEGLDHTRADEGRHVGFGMSKLKELVQDEGVDPTVIDETVAELVPLVQNIVNDEEYQEDRGVPSEELEMYATEKHVERMEQVKDAARELPEVDELVALDD